MFLTQSKIAIEQIGRLCKRLNNSTLNHNEWHYAMEKEYIHLSFEQTKKRFGPVWKWNDVFQSIAILHDYTLFSLQCVDRMHAEHCRVQSNEISTQNETTTTKILIFIFPFVLSLRLASNSKSPFLFSFYFHATMNTKWCTFPLETFC